MNRFRKILEGGDLRSVGRSNEIVKQIVNQRSLDELFQHLNDRDRKVVMRTADIIEKVTLRYPDFLQKHKTNLLTLCRTAVDKELTWHLALLVSRIKLTDKELGSTWNLLTNWATDKSESKIVRVNSIQGLFNLLQQNSELSQDFGLTISENENERIPSINARIRKLRSASS